MDYSWTDQFLGEIAAVHKLWNRVISVHDRSPTVCFIACLCNYCHNHHMPCETLTWVKIVAAVICRSRDCKRCWAVPGANSSSLSTEKPVKSRFLCTGLLSANNKLILPYMLSQRSAKIQNTTPPSSLAGTMPDMSSPQKQHHLQ